MHWHVSGETASSNCDTRTLTTETPGTSITCWATNNGESGEYTVTVKLDKTAPTVSQATPARAPDSNGWFNHAVTFSFAGNGGTSGIDLCVPATYSGPDSGSASITGTCRDKAGNSASRAFSLAYDATPPGVRAAPSRPPDRYGWYSRDVQIVFTGSDATSDIDACTRMLYGQPNGERASVTGSCRDRAGNEAFSAFLFRYSEPLLLPRSGTRVTAPPLLDWVPVLRARYYNVQLWRNGQKILSKWPRASQLQLRRTWRYAGQRFRLEPGRYTWHVWPRLRGRYGKPLGKSTFRAVRAATV